MARRLPNGLRRCDFDKCTRAAGAQGRWTLIDLTGWYCRPHLNIARTDP